MGYTSPSFLLLGVVFKYILPKVYIPTIFSWINIVALSLSSIFLYRVCKKFISPKLSLFVVMVFALNLSRTIPEAMETPIFLLVMFIFLDTLFSEKYYWSSVFLSLALLTRPDAGLIAVLALIFWWQKVGFQKTVKLVSVCIAVALPWLIFSTFYYGSFIPQSLAAKLHVNDIINQSKYQAFKVQLSDMSRIYWGKIFDPDNIPLQVVFNLTPLLVLIFFGIKKYLNKDNWIIFAIPVLYFVSFSISNPVMWPWYISQVQPFWIIFSLFGLFYLLNKTEKVWLKVIISLLIISGPFYWWANNIVSQNQGTKLALFKIGTYLNENMKPGETIGTNSLGVVGFTVDAYVFDFFGLMNYDSVAFYPIKDPCLDKSVQFVIPPDLVKFAMVDWIVTGGESEFVKCFREGKWFKKNYEAVYVESLGYTGNIWKLKKR